MDSAYDKALKHKANLERELAEVESFLRLYRRFSGNGDALREPVTQPLAAHDRQAVQESNLNRTILRRERPKGRPGQFADIAAQILQERGRPMTRTELADEFARLGIELPSDDKPRYLGTILWRHNERFLNSGDGYWLQGVPLPGTNVELRQIGFEGAPPPDLDPKAIEDDENDREPGPRAKSMSAGKPLGSF